MTASVSPALTGAPSLIGSSAMVPALWAVISFSIFIASMMHSSWPSSTCWPASTRTFHMLPWSGETSVSPPSPPPPPPPGPPPPAGARPPPGAGPPAGRRGDGRRSRAVDARRRRGADDLDLEAAPRDLDRVVARDRLAVLGRAGARLGGREGEPLEPGGVLDEVAARLAAGPLLGRQQGTVERDQRLEALDLVLGQRAEHPLRRLLAVGVPDDQLRD